LKKEDAKKRTISALLKIAREHFTRYGYYDVSLERIAEEGKVTRGAVYHHFKNKKGLFLAVLETVQEDVAARIEQEAIKSDDPWQQLILGCLGFINGANTKECRRILLIDAPVVVGWDAWREADQKNSMNVLLEHINDLKKQGFLAKDVNTDLMTRSVSGALNELALTHSTSAPPETNEAIHNTITQMLSGFKSQDN